jgi:protein gp37
VTRNRRGKLNWTGKIRFLSDRLLKPLRKPKPTTWFVNSMSDLFHEDIPDEEINQVFAVMRMCPQHTFQVLTKRPDRMQAFIKGSEYINGRGFVVGLEIGSFPEGLTSDQEDEWADRGDAWKDRVTVAERHAWPLPNVWLGVSAEEHWAAQERVRVLLQTPAAVRFVSLEPLLGPIALTNLGTPGSAQAYGGHGWSALWKTPLRPALDWVIAGGESGPTARPMRAAWARQQRDHCIAANVPFFFKQWGAAQTGRLLDGRTWDQLPQTPMAPIAAPGDEAGN